MTTDTKTRDVICLKGSAQLVQEFFRKLLKNVVILKLNNLLMSTTSSSSYFGLTILILL